MRPGGGGGFCPVRSQSWLRHDEVTPSIPEICRRDQVLHHRDRQQGRPSASGLEQVGHEEHLWDTQEGLALIFKNKRPQRNTGGSRKVDRSVVHLPQYHTAARGVGIRKDRVAYRAQRNRRGVRKWIHSLCSRPPGPPVGTQPAHRWGGACGPRPGTGRCRRTS